MDKLPRLTRLFIGMGSQRKYALIKENSIQPAIARLLLQCISFCYFSCKSFLFIFFSCESHVTYNRTKARGIQVQEDLTRDILLNGEADQPFQPAWQDRLRTAQGDASLWYTVRPHGVQRPWPPGVPFPAGATGGAGPYPPLPLPIPKDDLPDVHRGTGNDFNYELNAAER